MDGRVGALRAALDEHGLAETPIMAYSAKYASAFYGPFREAAESAPARGDRRGYQMDPANAREGVREAELDAAEGADVIMVKPALPYLDVIRRVKDATNLPVAAYNVSGEYAMLKSAAAAGPARRARRGARGAHRHPPRRRRHRDHLPREGRRHDGSRSTAQGAVAQGRLRRPARRDRQAAAEPPAGQLPAGPAPVRGGRQPRRPQRGGGAGARRLPARQADHPRDHADLRHARIRLRLDARRGEGRSRAPAPRGAVHQHASRASRTTTSATTTSTSGSRSRSSRARSWASTGRST